MTTTTMLPPREGWRDHRALPAIRTAFVRLCPQYQVLEMAARPGAEEHLIEFKVFVRNQRRAIGWATLDATDELLALETGHAWVAKGLADALLSSE